MDQVIRPFLGTLRRTQYLPREQLLDYQHGMLDRLLRHARMHVPFYRDSGRLDPLFRRDDSIDWERWEEIPILTRQDLQSGGARLRSDHVPDQHGHVWSKSTSGSTGEPLTVVQTDLSGGVAWAGVLLRALERNGIDPTRRLAHFTTSIIENVQETRREQAWCPEFWQLGLRGERIDIAATRPADDLVLAVAALQPDYVQIFPTNIQLMAAHDPQRLLAEAGLKAVITYGERFEPQAKAEIKERLNCPVLELYASIEGGFIATTCPHCGRFHVEAEAIRVEVIGDEGRAVAPGDSGRVVITPIYNYAMPLIRYALADVARTGADGGCAITLPVLDEVLGRERVPFIFRGNIAVRPAIHTATFIRYLGARRFQIAQVADDRCEVRFVPGSIDRADMQFEEVTRVLRASWWDGLQVDYKIVDSLPDTAKPQVYVREIPEPQAS